MIPILWFCGPPGVGKTAVAWDIYGRLQRGGAEPAYVDVDQLGICYPPRAEDPDRHALKARNVAALRANFAAAGARCLIVSGVVDAGRGPDVGALGGPPVMVVRLRADADELRERLLRRDGPSAQTQAAVEEADAFDRSAFADRPLDTSGLSIDQAATRVCAEIGDWPPAGASASRSANGAAAAIDGELLWLTGPPGVGKSTIGFRAYLDVLGAGEPAAYVDVDQLGFCSPSPGDHSLRAGNLAALWRNFHEAGARRAIVVGRVFAPSEALAYEQALPGAHVTWRQLHAGDAEFIRRILSRSRGGSWCEPGDALRDRPRDELLALAERAIGVGRRLDRDKIGLPIDVDGLDVEQAAATLLAGWPATPP